MQKKLKIAAFAGIVYLVSFLPELTLEIMRDYYHTGGATKTFLLFFYILSTLSTVFFYYGFVVIGNKFDNHLLVVGQNNWSFGVTFIWILRYCFWYRFISDA